MMRLEEGPVVLAAVAAFAAVAQWYDEIVQEKLQLASGCCIA